MLFDKMDQAWSQGLHFLGCIDRFLESDFVIVLAIWLVLVIVGMRIISCACTE